MENQGIGISHLPNQRYRSFCKNGIDYNIMVVGSKGSGKTSFINMLLNKKILLENPFSEKDGIKMASFYQRESNFPFSVIPGEVDLSEVTKSKSLVNFQITEAHFTEKKFNIRLSVTEVDGIGDRVDNTGCWKPIIAHITDMFADYRLQEKNDVKNLIHDKRIHICLYFIDSAIVPISSLDLCVMKEISQYCNLIPVVSRSDVLTESEIESVYTEIRQRILSEGIAYCDPRSTKSMRIITDNSPFFIVSSTLDNKNTRERQLEYGTINLDSEEFEDLTELKKILIEEHMLDLIESTDYYYEIYRADCMTKQLYDEGGWTEEEFELMSDFSKRFKAANQEYNNKHVEYLTRKSLLEKSTDCGENEIAHNITSPQSTPFSVNEKSSELGTQSAK